MSTHAKWSPSASHRWLTCPASVTVPATGPRETSPAAEEGTRLHELAEDILVGLDRTIEEPIQAYVDYIREHMANPLRSVFLEDSVALEPVTGEEEAYGTIDALITGPDYLEIVDLKTGARTVSVVGNTQLQLYAAAVVAELDYTGKVLLTIVQHGEAFTTEIFTDTLAIFAAMVHDHVEAAEDSADHTYNPTLAACRWCPHMLNLSCQAVQDMQQDIAASDFGLPDEGSADQLGDMLTKVPLMLKWCEVVKERANDQMNKGNSVTGFKVVRGQTRRYWNDRAETRLVEVLGEDAYAKKLIGLGVAEKLMDISDLTDKPEGKPILVPEGDKRPVIEDAATDFQTEINSN